MGATVPDPFYEGTWISYPYQEQAYSCLTPPVQPSNGTIPIPSGSGLGVEPDLANWDPALSIYD